MNDSPSAWKTLIDEWVAREQRVYPDAPIDLDSVTVRDAVEIDDQAFVLVSFDVTYPWPSEEDTSGASRRHNTAVLQAQRVRQPWVEHDASRSLTKLITADRRVVVHEHALGRRRAFSGHVAEDVDGVTVHFDDDSSTQASIVDGWFLVVAPGDRRVDAVTIGVNGDGARVPVMRDDVDEMFDNVRLTRGSSPTPMYFTPLDLRSVMPLIIWERVGSVVLVAVCLEQYDDGGILRLRIDGIRNDDDMFVSWPRISLTAANGDAISSAVVGEYGLADTMMIDVGFRPWVGDGSGMIGVTVAGLRGLTGQIDPISLALDIRDVRRR